MPASAAWILDAVVQVTKFLVRQGWPLDLVVRWANDHGIEDQSKIRSHSHDVEIYIPEISADAVEIVEQEFRARHGASFRLDVTTGENVWGSILVRDIASSPTLGTIADLELRALRIEDLFLLKLASGRTRDIDDLDLLASRTTSDALVDRWNQLIKWHGDRQAILGFADALVVQLQRLFGCDPVATIARLEVTAGQRELLLDSYHGKGSG